jgi:DNA-directed RNA polymerase subunit RPC12/RpoP
MWMQRKEIPMHEEKSQARPAEQSIPEGLRAAESRETSGKVAGGPDPEGPAEGLLTLVCFKCGKEYYFDDGSPPEDLTCEKCGNTVFRSFFSPDPSDEAARDFVDSTARDLDPDDAETDTLPGDVLDLNRD